MQRTAVLLHTLPDGASHFDWLIDTGGSAERVTTFRTGVRPDAPGTDRFAAERIPDHRRDYLTYAGPVSGGRGDVRPVASGRVLSSEFTGETLRIVVEFDGVRRAWEGRRLSDATPAEWEFAPSPLGPG